MATITFGAKPSHFAKLIETHLEDVVARRALSVCRQAGPQTCQFIAAEAAARTDVYYRPHRSASLHSPSSYGGNVARPANNVVVMNIHIVGDDLFKAKFFSVNFGSTDHDVTPHGNYMLAWPNKATGKIVKAWRTHPSGIVGRHFYEAGIKRGVALIAAGL